MPLTLLTGPANAAKAGVAFDRLRARLADDPLLVVPTSADVEHYQRELAESGIVFGAEVRTFSRLIALIAERTGVRGRPLGAVARERVVRATISDARLKRLARSAASAGFAHAAGSLFAELQRELVTPSRLRAALRAWQAEGDAGRCAEAAEAARLYADYVTRLEALGAYDEEGFAWAALDALRRAPLDWGGRPVLFYGFDDLTRTELDAVETLVRHAEADVLVSLPYEAGRAAFGGRATTVELLRPLAAEHVALPERSDHYAPDSRSALHHLERNLFEPAPAPAADHAGVLLLEAGGERAEAELVAAEVLNLLRGGTPAGGIAVLSRSGAGGQDLLAQILEGYGLPVARRRQVPLSSTRLGAGLLALVALSVGDGEPADLLRWLRTPGVLASSAPVDALEVAVMRGGADDVAAARRAWRGPVGALSAVDAVGVAASAGPAALLDELLVQLERVWSAPHARAAAVLDADEAADARVVAALRTATRDLQRLAEADPALLPDVAAVGEALSGVSVRERDARAGVLIADPLDIRARRFRAVFATGLQDDVIPRPEPPDPFLDDDDRRALARASGLALPLAGDGVADERHLFYSICSRPQELLALSWRSSSEEGDPLQPSPFLTDVRDLFDERLWNARRRRLLAEVTWPESTAPTPLERRRARAAARQEAEPPALSPPASALVLQVLAAREFEPARGLESFAACGVRWLVELLLRPSTLEPDSEPLWRGSVAHAVLERTLTLMREETGSARLTPERIPDALEALGTAVREREGRTRGARRRAGLRGLQADLARYLAEECRSGPGFEPRWLEWSFGRDADGPPALELADGTRVSGRIDRVDADARQAVVRDYKNSKAAPGARWKEDGSLQAGLYAIAVGELLGLDPVGALYQPLSGADLRPRGIVRSDLPGTYVGNDVLDDEDFRVALAEVRERAGEAARRIRTGDIRPCAASCSSRGCLYPGICRAADAQDGAADPEDAG